MSHSIKERFIPFRRADIIRRCLDDSQLSTQERDVLADLCKLITHIYHYQFHESLELLKDCYAPANPDADTHSIYPVTDEEKKVLEATLVDELRKLLDAANFDQITEEDLQQAFAEESLFKVKLSVDFDDFEQILFFRRGESERTETLRQFFGLRKKQITFSNFDRVVVYVKFKDQKYFDQQERKTLFFKPGSTLIKLFRNIPRSDLEMLFPNTEVRMKPIDKLIIGVPAAVGGIVMLATKLGTTLLLISTLVAFWLGMRNEPVELDQTALLALAAGLGTLGAFLWKQFSNFKNRKIRFMKMLADSLYFKNLDNNTGVFHRLIDAAEEEECKEAILAYFFLFRSGKALTADQLDDQIEEWFEDQFNHTLDFEVKDAISKLEALGIIHSEQGTISVIPPEDARLILDSLWDNYFVYKASSDKPE